MPTLIEYASIVQIIQKNNKEEYLPCKYENILEIPVTTLEGREYGKLEHLVYGKKLLLIVNVASKSLLAYKNYTQLVELHDKYKD